MAGQIQLRDFPHTPGKRKPIPDGRRTVQHPDPVGFAADGVVVVVLEHGVKLERIRQPFAAQTEDQLPLLRHLEPVVVDHREHEGLVVVLFDVPERRQMEHPFGKGGGRERTGGGKDGERLLKEEAQRHFPDMRRLNEALLNV